MEEKQLPARNDVQTYAVPWSIMDTWLGVGLLVFVNILLLAAVLMGNARQVMQNAGVLLVELIYLLPLVVIFTWRRIPWKYLGFGKFSLNTLALGFVLLIASYLIIIPHNLILDKLGIGTQGEQILEIFNELESPIWLVLAGAVVAPVVEEIFFRGFLFQGFRQKYGWVAAIILSSAIFAAAHLDPVSLIPTFVLGSVLAYLYHISNSVWPGIIFHFLVNAFGLLVFYLVTQFPGLIPS